VQKEGVEKQFSLPSDRIYDQIKGYSSDWEKIHKRWGGGGKGKEICEQNAARVYCEVLKASRLTHRDKPQQPFNVGREFDVFWLAGGNQLAKKKGARQYKRSFLTWVVKRERGYSL